MKAIVMRGLTIGLGAAALATITGSRPGNTIASLTTRIREREYLDKYLAVLNTSDGGRDCETPFLK